MGNGASSVSKMPLFGKTKDEPRSPTTAEYKSRLEHKLYIARETPEPVFDLSACNLKEVPSGIYSLCKVFRKETLYLQENLLTSLSGGGSFQDLSLLQFLDVHNNKLTKLPDEIGMYLINLKVLNVENNRIKHLPNSICQLTHLEVFDVSENCLKDLPAGLGNLKSLKKLNVRRNDRLTRLPKELCGARCLTVLLLDAANFVYPNAEIASEGTEAMMRFLCGEMDTEYVPPSEIEGDVVDNVIVVDTLQAIENSDRALQAKLLELERRKELKHSERLALEQQLEEQQKLEAIMQAHRRQDQQKLLSDLTEQQNKLDSDILAVQAQRDAERNNLLQCLYEEEMRADTLITHLLAINEQERDPRLLADAIEKEFQEMEAMLSSKHAESEELRKRDVLGAMQSLLEEEFKKENIRRQYETSRNEIVQLALSSEVLLDQQVNAVLDVADHERQTLIESLLEDKNFQRDAFATLLLKQDERNQQLLHQMSLVQNELASLTMIETKKRNLQVEFEMDVLQEKRFLLTELLSQLIKQQQTRKDQLLQWLKEAEARQNDEACDFWLVQYQRLMDSQPEQLREKAFALDPAVRELLFCCGAEHYIPYFIRHGVTMHQLCLMTDQDLQEIGVKNASMRAAILKAAASFNETKAAVATKLARLQSTDTPPPMASTIAEDGALPLPAAVPAREPSPLPEEVPLPSAPDLDEDGSKLVENECVVCLDNKCGLIFLPCGHVCTCRNCGDTLQACPICREDIQQKVQLFFS